MTISAEWARRWILDHALRLWSETGVDREGFGVWEALSHHGVPLIEREKRFRVTLRQAYVFARLETWYHAGSGDLALRLFDEAVMLGLDCADAPLPGRVDRWGRTLDAPHDLYDIAFFILADAALAPLGRGPENRLLDALSRLKARRGWREALAPGREHRRQNPHMHLFEAAVAQVSAGREAYRPIAKECLDLFLDIFLRDDGAVTEFFTDDWTPAENDTRIEPGHIAEWVFLLHRAGPVLGIEVEELSAKLFDKASSFICPDGWLPDVAGSQSAGRRFWPQIELLKAMLCQENHSCGDVRLADDLLDRIAKRYLSTPVPGGWYDAFDSKGALISNDMPASTGYHLIPAIAFYCALRSGDEKILRSFP